MLEIGLVCAIFGNESDEKHLHIHPEIRRAGHSGLEIGIKRTPIF